MVGAIVNFVLVSLVALNVANAQSSCPTFPGYQFYQGKDSPGNEIATVAPASIQDIIAACNARSDCVAVNTNGYLKQRIVPSFSWTTWTDSPCKGMYIRVFPPSPPMPPTPPGSALLCWAGRSIPGVTMKSFPTTDVDACRVAMYSTVDATAFSVSNIGGCKVLNQLMYTNVGLGPDRNNIVTCAKTSAAATQLLQNGVTYSDLMRVGTVPPAYSLHVGDYTPCHSDTDCMLTSPTNSYCLKCSNNSGLNTCATYNLPYSSCVCAASIIMGSLECPRGSTCSNSSVAATSGAMMNYCVMQNIPEGPEVVPAWLWEDYLFLALFIPAIVIGVLIIGSLLVALVKLLMSRRTPSPSKAAGDEEAPTALITPKPTSCSVHLTHLLPNFLFWSAYSFLIVGAHFGLHKGDSDWTIAMWVCVGVLIGSWLFNVVSKVMWRRARATYVECDNVMTAEQAVEYVRGLQSAAPKMFGSIDVFHKEQRSRAVKGGKEGVEEMYEERVSTGTYNAYLNITSCMDLSGDLNVLEGISTTTRVTVTCNPVGADPASEAAWTGLTDYMASKYSHLDKCYTATKHAWLNGKEEHQLLVQRPPSGCSAIMRSDCVYYLFVVVCWDWLHVMWCSSVSEGVEIKLTKRFTANPTPTDKVPEGCAPEPDAPLIELAEEEERKVEEEKVEEEEEERKVEEGREEEEERKEGEEEEKKEEGV